MKNYFLLLSLLVTVTQASEFQVIKSVAACYMTAGESLNTAISLSNKIARNKCRESSHSQEKLSYREVELSASCNGATVISEYICTKERPACCQGYCSQEPFCSEI